MNNAQLQGLRNLAARNGGYPVRLAFTREFTRGNLVGLTHEDSMGFCKALDAEEWVSAINSANARGKVDYKIISWKTEEV